MTFSESIQICFKKYTDFKGRASKSEYWWWVLFVFMISVVGQMIGDLAGVLVTIPTLLPCLAVTARRLHDTDRSGWWQLIALIPLIGWAVMIYLCVQPSTSEHRLG
ncbi:DUF805 domain-containing protein [Roseateles oligotrophus]|uniref:DUF805 domain-containing protein n=1 Tax=Roseateles oligotrophus TaxID=1769250 RepID=A0ABT2YJ61_9BURK|nr:DUF805 domain-containing protein [Roseateles oligotrophus]MCV2370063.1 DUF805 domain-containing protein [Roseateles oligotrophus]